MSKVIDVSSKLGEYMLKGWILTDRTCPTANCNVPLMRSPKSTVPTVHYCANCDVDPYARAPSPPPAGAMSATPTSPAASSSAVSRPSTPATEVSSGLSSPTFAPAPETAESIRRRQQLDEASAEIGRKMLQGYAMLADECPNTNCLGVPLVRPPKAGGERDPRKECVVCKRTYINEVDAAQWEQTHPTTVVRPETSSVPALNIPTLSLSTVTGSGSGVTREPERSQVRTQQQPTATHLHGVPTISALSSSDLRASRASAAPATRVPTSGNVVQMSSDALEQALDALRARLSAETASVSTMDVAAVGVIADSMSRTAQALGHLAQLQKRT